MYDLTNEQQKILSTVLKEYLNVSDWKGLFVQTDCEAFAQQHTHFYNEDSWDNGSIEDHLEQDCDDALAFILNKDSKYLKIIWEMPGVKTMTLRKDENFHADMETLIENANSQTTSIHSNSDSDANQDPFHILDEAENLLGSNGTIETNGLVHLALLNFLKQTCKENEISTNDDDSISVLHANVNEYIKRQLDTSLNNTSLLRTTTLITETIDDLCKQNLDENQISKADVQYAISVSRSIMTYIDELIGDSKG